MSEVRRVLLAGATGLVGSRTMELAIDHPWLRLIALSRREAPMPRGVRMEMLVAEPAGWPEAVAAIAPEAVICALGTTISQAGSEEAFRAVDYDLVLSLAKAAREANVANFVLISSAGADAHGKAFYLRVKGEIEAAVTKLRFRRLDILRPGLLRGSRPNGTRPLEILGRFASPLTDLLLHGDSRRFRSIDARIVAAAAAQCAREKPQGRWLHDNDSIQRHARRLDGHA
jgi:uncharacterized protein YbjT (DUF2867 family)